MARFTLTDKAKFDLKEIGHYTESHWGRDQRNIYLTLLDACFHQLADHPQKGRDCSDIKPGYRKFNAGSHIIFYPVKGSDSIEIVRILHSRMDADTRLLD